jgi:voltage-gated potassium channel Kch
MLTTMNRLSLFWSTDRSLSVFLGLLLVAVFIVLPLAEQEGMLIASVGFSVLLVSGVALVAKNRMTRGLVAGAAGVALIIHWTQHVVPGTGLSMMSAFSSLCFLGILAGVVFREVLNKGPITLHRVQGAVAVYLLLGLIWAFAYDMVLLSAPDAFHSSELTVQHKTVTPPLIYFSVMTLTTVGYGDITPIHPMARALAMLEAVIGQLFPVILIARLVAMELQFRNSR